MCIDDYIDMFDIDSKYFAKTYDIIEYLIKDFNEQKKSLDRQYEKEIQEKEKRSCYHCDWFHNSINICSKLNFSPPSEFNFHCTKYTEEKVNKYKQNS